MWHSKLSHAFKAGDIKYYWRIHCKRMEKQGLTPITYARFWDRLERGWMLKDAINTPSCNVSKPKPSVYDTQWRQFMMLYFGGENNTKEILDGLIQDKMNRIQMPKPKPTLLDRIKRLFKKRA